MKTGYLRGYTKLIRHKDVADVDDHKKQDFWESVFRWVSLRKVQSVVSVLKEQIDGQRMDKAFYIIAITDVDVI